MKIYNPIITGSLTVSGSLSTTTDFTLGYSQLTGKPALVSGSSQLTYTGLQSIPQDIVSSSNQISASGFLTSASAAQDGFGAGAVSYTGLLNVPNNIVSSSAQTIKNFPDNVVSSSIQTIANLPTNTVSGSAQINFSGSYESIVVKVVNDGGNKYQIDGVTAPKLTLHKGHTYRFDMSNNTNSNHPLLFRLPNDTSYSDGVSQVGVAGQAGSYTNFHVGYNAPTNLKYYCTVHGNGMGNEIKILDGFNTNLSGSVTISGSLNVTGDVTAFSTSDERLKTNVTPILDSLNKLGEIKGYEYDWIANEHHNNTGHDLGVIAQEIEKIAPEAVTTRDNGYKAVRYEKLIPILIQAIKELNNKVSKLEDANR